MTLHFPCRFALLLPAFAGALLLSSTTRAQGSRPPGRIVTEKDAILLLPSELVAAPRVHRIWFSPDDRYALVERWDAKTASGTRLDPTTLFEPLRSEEKTLIFWDRRSRKAREVWSTTDSFDIERVEWLPASDVALVHARKILPQAPRKPTEASEGIRHINHLLRINATEDRAKVLSHFEYHDYNPVELHVSPRLPLAILLTRHFDPVDSSPAPESGAQAGPARELRQMLYLVDGKGALHISKIQPPPLDELTVQWTSEGRPLMVLPILDKKKDGYTHITYTLDPRTFQLHPVTTAPPLFKDTLPKKAPQSLQVKTSTAAVREKETSFDLRALWLEHAAGGPESRTLICADCSEGRVMAGGEILVYRSRGSLWAVPLIKTTPSVLQAQQKQFLKSIALSNAESLAYNLVGYVTRNRDGKFPAPHEIFEVLPHPIKEDPSVLYKDFLYTFPGGKIPEGQKPESVQIGRYQSPVGHVLIFADGHVEWRDK